MALQRRLLMDIAELREDPYPNLKIHPRNNLGGACLILTPDQREPLHLTVRFGTNYPLQAPSISIRSRVSHPNVFNSYICASILNTAEGYTPAYTLKGICIQLLSFFSSDRIEQQDGGGPVDLSQYRAQSSLVIPSGSLLYRCYACGFRSNEAHLEDATMFGRDGGAPTVTVRMPFSESKTLNLPLTSGEYPTTNAVIDHLPVTGKTGSMNPFQKLPNEIAMFVLEELDSASLTAAATACRGIRELINSNDYIRLCELQCFCLKESFMKLRLGFGVSASWHGRQGSVKSEFDLLSLEAFEHHAVRRSIQGLTFQHWLPLALSRRHWQAVKSLVEPSLKKLAKAAQFPEAPNVNVLYAFMTNVVVKLSQEFEDKWTSSVNVKSTLRHASEKAIESYFSLFHLLLCLAIDQPDIVKEANDRVALFEDGHTSKEDCPNLGHLLTLTLVSDRGLTPSLSLAIIHEAVIRNVVWMLDSKGANMPELSYLEPTSISDYRLKRTFEASRTSYRILMFQSLFAKIARPADTPISTICDEIFDRHGAPPTGIAEKLASDIRHLRTITSFPEFFDVMGVPYDPSSTEFPTFLKESITLSVKKGYSRMPIKQDKALALRMLKEPKVERAKGVTPDQAYTGRSKGVAISFFPKKRKKGRSQG